jgi:hypothetical protein
MCIGTFSHCLLFNGAGDGATDGNQRQIRIEPPQFIQYAKAADRVPALGVDIEDDGRDCLLLLRPLRQTVIFAALGHLAPGLNFESHKAHEFVVG